jgi:hypothetical protein
MQQTNKFNMPAIMQAMYQAPQTPMTPQQQAYWKLNGENGQAANEAINRMPFVLDPASMFGQDRAQIKASMYQPKPAEGGEAAQPAAPQDPQAQMLALLQSNPELLPLIMQQMGGQNQQVVVPSNQGP